MSPKRKKHKKHTKNVESESESSLAKITKNESESEGETTQKTSQKQIKQETQKRKNVERESESPPKKNTQKASKKQKNSERSSAGITRQDSGLTRAVKELSIRFDSSSRNVERESESLPKETTQKAQETAEQSSAVSGRRITRQVSDPTRIKDLSVRSDSSSSSRSSYDTKDLPPKDFLMKRLDENTPVRRSKRAATVSSKAVVDHSGSSNDEGLYILIDSPDLLSKFASSFNLEDTKALNVIFVGSEDRNDVIPGLMGVNDTEIPTKLLLPDISETDFGISIDGIKNLNLPNDAKSFLFQMSAMIKNEDAVSGTSEAKTDTVVSTILNNLAIEWPLNILQHPPLFFKIFDREISANPEFTISSFNINVIIVEDKHLKNTTIDNGCGEPQIAAELLAAAYKNRQGNVMGDQVLFAIRFICSYVTFYRFEVSNGYFRELAIGLPANEYITITRWPAQNTKTSGINLKTANGRLQVLRCLIALRNYAKDNAEG